jgi:hypothetical protein
MGDERSIDSEFGDAPVAVAAPSPNGTADHGAPEADAMDGSAADSSADAPAEASADAPAADESASDDATADAPDFLTQLTRAMQATAGAERGRASEEIERRSSGHIAAIRARAEAEALKMRDLAGDDRRAIERWADTERQRINAERDRRTKELEADLTESLAEHGRQTDVQIQAVEAVVAKHRSDVDAFFASLDGETDPVRLAQRAGQRPTFPDLDRLSTPSPSEPTDMAAATATPITTPAASEASPAAASTDTASQATDAEPVAVMDPVARLGLLKHSPEPSPFAKPAVPTDGSSGMRPSVASPIAERTSTRPDEARAVATPQAHNGPMSWLRRNNDQDK